MDIQSAVLWAFGVAIVVLGAILKYIANKAEKNADRISEVERKIADIRAENPRLYADHGDVRRVEEQISKVQYDLTALGAEVRTSMVGIAEKLNQLIGQLQNRG